MSKNIFSTVVALALIALVGSANASIIYSSDFETSAGGWTASGDWERGIPVGFNGQFGSLEPVGGNSGDFAWGTVIGGDHSVSTDSVLSQTFDFTGFMNVAINFAEWIDSGGNSFDIGFMEINGSQEYVSDGFSNDAWRNVPLSLSAYDDTSAVDISFVFSSTSVVERTGWYLDDIEITGDLINPVTVPVPASLLLIGAGLAGLGCSRRKKA